jgi:hypothetical protein
MDTDRRAVDHDDIAIESLGNLAQNMVPDARFAPPNEPVGAVVCGPYRSGTPAQREPVRKRHKMPLITRRSSTLSTPRGLFGTNGWMTVHSKSVRSNRRRVIINLSFWHISIPFRGRPHQHQEQPISVLSSAIVVSLASFAFSRIAKIRLSRPASNANGGGCSGPHHNWLENGSATGEHVA